jgi:hypothetical protein
MFYSESPNGSISSIQLIFSSAGVGGVYLNFHNTASKLVPLRIETLSLTGLYVLYNTSSCWHGWELKTVAEFEYLYNVITSVSSHSVRVILLTYKYVLSYILQSSESCLGCKGRLQCTYICTYICISH